MASEEKLTPNPTEVSLPHSLKDWDSFCQDVENGVFVEEMFDDGLHNDSLDGDNIFGNTLPILTPTSIVPNYGKRYSLDVNKIKLPLNNK